MRASETSYKDIKVRLKQRLEYVSQDIPMMMRELSKRDSSELRTPSLAAEKRSYDMVVVGLGCAGSSSAITAADCGRNVLIIDRYDGGGSTRRSGGVIYFGGGTDLQRASKVGDTLDLMFDYVSSENGGVSSPETIRQFCNESSANFRWLEQRCRVRFRDKGDGVNVYPDKTSYPPSSVSLYSSGNETPKIPRGHRVLGEYLTGNILFSALYKQLETHPNITIATHTRAIGLVMKDQACIGIRAKVLPENDRLRAAHVMLHEIGSDSPMIDPSRVVDRTCVKTETAMFRNFGVDVNIQARAVILATGGFFFNSKMVKKYAPKYLGLMPLGNLGDNGSGITMAVRDANAKTKSMDRCSAWKFINPPSAFARAVLVNTRGERVTREDKYGASIADELLQRHEGRGFLILDENMYKEALTEVNDPSSNLQPDQRMQAKLNLLRNRKFGHTLRELEQQCKIPEMSLQRSIREYNRCIQELGKDEKFEKNQTYLSVLDEYGPCYAIRMDLKRNVFWPTPAMSLGGLEVDESTGLVISAHTNESIPGLYAAGRCACGIASNYYVSGLSLADCVFSGRRAGRNAAATFSSKY